MWECWIEHFGWTVLSCLGTKYPRWFPCYRGCTLKVVQSRFCFLLLLFVLSSVVILIFVLYEAINCFELNWIELNWRNMTNDKITTHVMACNTHCIARRGIVDQRLGISHINGYVCQSPNPLDPRSSDAHTRLRTGILVVQQVIYLLSCIKQSLPYWWLNHQETASVKF